jgi:type IV pilus assembly protein PilF
MNQLIPALILAFLFNTACSTSGNKSLSDEEKSKIYLESAAGSLNYGDTTSALKQLLEAEKLDSDNHEIAYLLALTYHQKNENELAIRAAKKAIQLAPDFSPAKNTLGKLLMDRQDLNGAEKLLKEAATDLTYRESYLSKTNLGLLYSKKNNPVEAEIWFSKAIHEAGNASCIASYYRGKMRLEKNELNSAKDDFKRASGSVCANYTEAHLALGTTLMRMKQFSQAKAKFIEIQQLFPSTDAAEKANQYLKEIQ